MQYMCARWIFSTVPLSVAHLAAEKKSATPFQRTELSPSAVRLSFFTSHDTVGFRIAITAVLYGDSSVTLYLKQAQWAPVPRGTES